MTCHTCLQPIIFYAHQAMGPAYGPRSERMRYYHPECCPTCPERHRVGGER